MNNQQKIQDNKHIFDALIKLAENETTEKKKIQLLQFASLWAVAEHTGQFSSFKIEKMLSTIADNHHVEESTFKENTFLHVMTDALPIGGHTPLANQWIQNSNKGETHSLALLNQRNPIPSWLKQSIKEANGEIYNIEDKSNPLSKALKLREIASSYAYIIMHVQMNDIVPCLAFSTEAFSRPIIFVNHADHIFWLGLSYIDMLANLTEAGNDFTLFKRGEVEQQVLPIPVSFDKDSTPSKKQILAQLNVPPHKKLILSMASAYKYKLFETYPLIDILLALSKKNPHFLFLIIGANKDSEQAWQNAYLTSNGKINAIGIKQPEEVSLYKGIADLYIDSFPINSYTSFLEFAGAGVPSLSLKTEFNMLDILKEKPNICATSNELLQKAEEVLNQDLYSKYDLEQDILDYYAAGPLWKSRKNELITKTPKVHMLHWNFAKKETIDSYDDIVYTLQPIQRKKALFSKDIDLVNNLRIMLIFHKYKYLSSKNIPSHLFKLIRKAISNSLKRR